MRNSEPLSGLLPLLLFSCPPNVYRLNCEFDGWQSAIHHNLNCSFIRLGGSWVIFLSVYIYIYITVFYSISVFHFTTVPLATIHSFGPGFQVQSDSDSPHQTMQSNFHFSICFFHLYNLLILWEYCQALLMPFSPGSYNPLVGPKSTSLSSSTCGPRGRVLLHFLFSFASLVNL